MTENFYIVAALMGNKKCYYFSLSCSPVGKEMYNAIDNNPTFFMDY